MKRICALLLAVLLILTVFTGCGGKSVTEVKEEPAQTEEKAPAAEEKEEAPAAEQVESTEKKFRVGLCLSTGGRGDRSFNDQAYDGVTRAVNEFGIEMDLAEPKELAEIEPFLTDFAKSGE